MTWMARRLPERLDPTVVLSGARTVIALAIAYHRPPGETGPIARYARGRDYHYAHRDRMKDLRKRLLALDPTVETYASVDTGVAMEKAWAERAGLGWIGKNGCLINPRARLVADVVGDVHRPRGRRLRRPRRAAAAATARSACPPARPGRSPAPGVVDARRCIAYHSIEHQDPVPPPLREGFAGRIFGCDVCQEVCPWNHRPQPEGDARFSPRPLSSLAPAEVAALAPERVRAAVGRDGGGAGALRRPAPERSLRHRHRAGSRRPRRRANAG